MRDLRELEYFQSLPLELKIQMTEVRLRGWHDYFGGDVYVSFSGGKDSRVLLDMARNIYPSIPAVFIDTGLEYPEIRSFVKTFDNVEVVRPKYRFDEVVKKYGYPLIGKEVAGKLYYGKKGAQWALNAFNGVDSNGEPSRYKQSHYGQWRYLLDADFVCGNVCCDVMKKNPAKAYEKRTGRAPIVATLTEESVLRRTKWVQNGCNAFHLKRPVSMPMSFWTEQDILKYIYDRKLSLANVYGEVVCEDGIYRTTGVDRTGCVFCCFGIHREKHPNRLQRLKETHPRLWEYSVYGGEYVGGLWQPNQDGLGLSHILDYIGVDYE